MANKYSNYFGGLFGSAKLVLGFILLLLLMVIASPQKAHAVSIALNPDPGKPPSPSPPAIPANIYDGIINACAANPPAELSTNYPIWGSETGVPSSNVSTTATYGQTSKIFDLNLAVIPCYGFQTTGNQWVTNVRDYVTGYDATQPGTVVVDPTETLNYAEANIFFGGQFAGAYNRDDLRLVYRPTGGFTQSGWYTIEVITKSVLAIFNVDTGPSYFCGGIVPAPAVTSLDNFSACPDIAFNFSMYVTVLPQNPVGSLEVANCSVFSGWAFDPDFGSSAINVQFYNGGTFIGQTVANTFRPDVGNHGFSFATPAAYKQLNTFPITAYALGLTNTGAADGTFTAIGTLTMGPCQSSSCSSIKGSLDGGASYGANIGNDGTFSVTRGVTFKMKLTYNNTGSTTWTTGNAANQVYVNTDAERFGTINGFGPPQIALSPDGGSTSVAPGGTASYTWTRDSGLNTPGPYNIKFQMVQQSVDWFPSSVSGIGNCKFNINIVAPPASLICGLVQISDNEVAAFANLSVDFRKDNVLYSAPAPAVITSVDVTAITPGVSNLPQNVAAVPASLNNNQQSKATATNISISSAGTYNFNFAIHWTGSPSTVNCPGSVNIVFKPYPKFYGSDVKAGGAFDTGTGNCTPNPQSPGNIYSFYTNSNGYNAGGSNQYAAFALGIINPFYTVSIRNVPGEQPLPLKGLSFANFPDNPANNGGNFDASFCVTDYYSKTRDLSPSLNSPNLASANLPGTGRHQVAITGNYTINPTEIANGAQIALFVDGNVTITGNITYKNSVLPPVAGKVWTSRDDIPYFAVITSPGHNINIDQNVTQLDGIYIAEPNAAPKTGLIHTCTNLSNLMQATDLFNSCYRRLIVFGGFVAKAVKFERTSGSVHLAEPLEKFDTNPNWAAETINYSPELFIAPSPLKNPEAQSCANNFICNYDAISTLPPLL